MAAILPTVPHFVFTIFEPLSLAAGFVVPIIDTRGFVNQQIPSTPLNQPLTATNQILALQLGNVYGLIGMIGIGVLYSTSEAIVVRNYLLACAVADIGHLCFTYVGMGYDAFVDVQSWNSLAWGNIGITMFLFTGRVLYLSGVLGKDRVVESTKKAVKNA